MHPNPIPGYQYIINMQIFEVLLVLLIKGKASHVMLESSFGDKVTIPLKMWHNQASIQLLDKVGIYHA